MAYRDRLRRINTDPTATEQMYQFPESIEIERPSSPDTWHPMAGIFLGIAALFMAAVMRAGIVSVTMAFCGVIFLAMSWGLKKLANEVRYRRVRVLEPADQLRFVPRRFIERMDNVVATALIAFWALLAVSWFTPHAAHVYNSAVGVLALLALPVVFAFYLWQLSLPRGLTLCPYGIRGVRRGFAINMPWDDVMSVTVEDLPGRGKLVISGRGGEIARAEATRFGSDARVVAHVIEHFRTHVSERADLAQGPPVLERFGVTDAGRGN